MADSLLENYNPLYDVHLRQYFTLPHMQKHLRRMGLLDSNGIPVAQNANVESELYARHHAMMEMMLKNRERILIQLADLQKKYDAAEKVEIYRRIRSGLTNLDDYKKNLSRSLSRPRRAETQPNSAERRRRASSNSFEDNEVIKRIEKTYEQPNSAPIIRNTYDRLSANAFKYQFLHKLDDTTLHNYKDSLMKQLQKLQRFRDVSFGPYSFARHQPSMQNSWFFRRRSLPPLMGSNTLHDPTRSLKSIKASNGQTNGSFEYKKRKNKSQSPRRYRRSSPAKRSMAQNAAGVKLPPIKREEPIRRPLPPLKPPRGTQRTSESSTEKEQTGPGMGTVLAAGAGAVIAAAVGGTIAAAVSGNESEHEIDSQTRTPSPKESESADEHEEEHRTPTPEEKPAEDEEYEEEQAQIEAEIAEKTPSPPPTAEIEQEHVDEPMQISPEPQDEEEDDVEHVEQGNEEEDLDEHVIGKREVGEEPEVENDGETGEMEPEDVHQEEQEEPFVEDAVVNQEVESSEELAEEIGHEEFDEPHEEDETAVDEAPGTEEHENAEEEHSADVDIEHRQQTPQEEEIQSVHHEEEPFPEEKDDKVNTHETPKSEHEDHPESEHEDVESHQEVISQHEIEAPPEPEVDTEEHEIAMEPGHENHLESEHEDIETQQEVASQHEVDASPESEHEAAPEPEDEDNHEFEHQVETHEEMVPESEHEEVETHQEETLEHEPEVDEGEHRVEDEVEPAGEEPEFHGQPQPEADDEEETVQTPEPKHEVETLAELEPSPEPEAEPIEIHEIEHPDEHETDEHGEVEVEAGEPEDPAYDDVQHEPEAESIHADDVEHTSVGGEDHITAEHFGGLSDPMTQSVYQEHGDTVDPETEEPGDGHHDTASIAASETGSAHRIEADNNDDYVHETEDRDRFNESSDAGFGTQSEPMPEDDEDEKSVKDFDHPETPVEHHNESELDSDAQFEVIHTDTPFEHDRPGSDAENKDVLEAPNDSARSLASFQQHEDETHEIETHHNEEHVENEPVHSSIHSLSENEGGHATRLPSQPSIEITAPSEFGDSQVDESSAPPTPSIHHHDEEHHDLETVHENGANDADKESIKTHESGTESVHHDADKENGDEEVGQGEL